MATIKIRRPGAYTNYLRSYTLMVDGSPAGTVRSSSEATVPIGPGAHELYLKIDWCRSNTVRFTAAADETIAFEVSTVNPFMAIFYVIFARDEYLMLRRTSSA